MDEKRYIISEAAQRTGVESHVLRYWEEELGLEIPRNEMGHRYYTESQIELFRQVKDLKESGFQLKAVKAVIGDGNNIAGRDIINEVKKYNEEHNESDNCVAATADIVVAPECGGIMRTSESTEAVVSHTDDRLAQFEQIIGSIVDRSLAANNERLSVEVTDRVSTKVIKEMDYLLRLREEAEEDRYKKLDETIRGLQRSGKEAVALREKGRRNRKRHLFSGKNS